MKEKQLNKVPSSFIADEGIIGNAVNRRAVLHKFSLKEKWKCHMGMKIREGAVTVNSG